MDLQLTFTIKLFAAHFTSIRPDRERYPHESGTEFYDGNIYNKLHKYMTVRELCTHGPTTDFYDGNVYHKDFVCHHLEELPSCFMVHK